MNPWKEENRGTRDAHLLDGRLCAYPAHKGGSYAIHLRVTLGYDSNVPYSVMHYTRYAEGSVTTERYGSHEFRRMRVWDAPEFSVNGEVVAACLHAVAYVNEEVMYDCPARVCLRIGVKICHPFEDETVIERWMPLRVRMATGPLAKVRI